MNLEYNQLGYFISQLALAAQHFGVSSQDAGSIEQSLNSRFNIRCAPATSANPPMLLSLCQNPTCPLAVPVSDCTAYNNLTAVGVTDSKPTTVTATQLTTATTAPSGQPSSSSVGAASTESSGLSTGGIAGVAVGGAAILLIGVIAVFYFRRKRSKTPPPTATNPPPQAAWNEQSYGSPTIHSTSTYIPKDAHQSYLSTGAPASEMDTSGYTNASPPPASPDPAAYQGYQGYRRYSEQQHQGWAPPPVEMDTSRTPGAGHGPFAPPLPSSAGGLEWQHHNNNSPAPSQEHYTRQQQYEQQSWGRRVE
jgi:hypothetical protein